MVKRIEYDEENRDYAGYVDGQIAVFGRTFFEVDNKLNELIYQRLTRLTRQHGTLK
jgi:hypothetical protein